ncbi:MAG: 50S ribosomal protein L21 [Actinobacteria bacterium]|nr:MAG: 50S ribosomal protein L21 [Actinomycetota bacterium]TMK46152.1 MAG: 50S ribosomal protein L21 [Actinomycetota bacterium]TMK66607.1 MAG: 50S ribosomal protein L21 [Actinomycetota bacterium]
MYAVIKTGGKQHRVKPGDVIEVEYMHGLGDTVTFHPLLVVDDDGKTHFGKQAEGAVVTAKPVGEQKGDKVRVMKYKNKTGYSRRQGHRQLMTLLEISDVSMAGEKKPAARKPAAKPSAKAPAKKAAPKETAEGQDEAAEEAGE